MVQYMYYLFLTSTDMMQYMYYLFLPPTDMVQYMYYLAETFPSLVTVLKIGSTHEDRPLYVAKVSNSSGNLKPAIWIDGGLYL